MDKEVINDLYNRAKGLGYKKSQEDFVQLLHSDKDVFNDNYSYVRSQGYNKDANSFSQLIGRGEAVKKKEPTQEPLRQDGSASASPSASGDKGRAEYHSQTPFHQLAERSAQKPKQQPIGEYEPITSQVAEQTIEQEKAAKAEQAIETGVRKPVEGRIGQALDYYDRVVAKEQEALDMGKEHNVQGGLEAYLRRRKIPITDELQSAIDNRDRKAFEKALRGISGIDKAVPDKIAQTIMQTDNTAVRDTEVQEMLVNDAVIRDAEIIQAAQTDDPIANLPQQDRFNPEGFDAVEIIKQNNPKFGAQISFDDFAAIKDKMLDPMVNDPIGLMEAYADFSERSLEQAKARLEQQGIKYEQVIGQYKSAKDAYKNSNEEASALAEQANTLSQKLERANAIEDEETRISTYNTLANQYNNIVSQYDAKIAERDAYLPAMEQIEQNPDLLAVANYEQVSEGVREFLDDIMSEQPSEGEELAPSGFWANTKNAFYNTKLAIKAMPQALAESVVLPLAFIETQLSKIGNNAYDIISQRELEKRYGGETVVANTVKEVADLAYSAATWLGRAGYTKLWTKEEDTPESFRELAGAIAERASEKQANMKPTVELLDAIKDGNAGEIAAGAVGGALGFVPSILVGLATRGTGFVPYFAGMEAISSAESKAEMSDREIREVFMNNDADYIVPITMGVIAGALERYGLVKLHKYFVARMSRSMARKVQEFAVNTGRQGIINWLEAGLSQYTEFYAESQDVEDAALKMTDFLFSEEGLNAGLTAAAGTALGIFGGRGIQYANRSFQEVTNMDLNDAIKEAVSEIDMAGAERSSVENLTMKILADGFNNLNESEQAQYEANKDIIDISVREVSEQYQTAMQEALGRGEDATTQLAVAAKDVGDTQVMYKGEVGVIKVDEGGKITFESDKRIYEIEGKPTDLLMDLGVEPYVAERQQALEEASKFDNAEVEAVANETPEVVVQAASEAAPEVVPTLDAALNENMNDTVSDALDKLDRSEELTEQEALQVETYLLDATERLSELKAQRPELGEHIDRLIDGLDVIDNLLGQREAYERTEERTEQREVESETPVQQPIERGEAEVAAEPIAAEAEPVRAEPLAPESTEVGTPVAETPRQAEISEEKTEVDTKPTEVEKVPKTPPKAAVEEDEEREQERKTRVHNTLAGLRSEYNSLTDAQKKRKKGSEIFSEINRLAQKLGYDFTHKHGQVSVKDERGKEIRKKRRPPEKIPTPTKDEVDFAKFYIDKGILNWDGDMFSPRIDLPMTRADIVKGEADIAKGNINTVPAKRLIRAINERKETQDFRYVMGAGAHQQAIYGDFDDLGQGFLTEAERKEIAENQDALAQEFDEWFNNLTEEQQEQFIYEAYGEETGLAEEIAADTQRRESEDDVSDEAQQIEKEPIKPQSEKDLAKALKDVFGLTDSQSKASAKLIGASAKGLIAAGIFKNEAEFWANFPSISIGESAEGVDAQAAYNRRNVGGRLLAFIKAMVDPDITSPHHEVAHWWYDLIALAAGEANKQAASIMSAFDKFANSAEGRAYWDANGFEGEFDANNYQYRQELWARGYEKFLYDGKAPSGLKEIFQAITDFFKQIYNAITKGDIDIHLTDAMRGIYSYILTGDEVNIERPEQKSDAEYKEEISETLGEIEAIDNQINKMIDEMPDDINDLLQAQKKSTFDKLADRIENWAKKALDKKPELTATEFLAAIRKGANTRGAIGVFGEDKIKDIFKAVANPKTADELFDKIAQGSISDLQELNFAEANKTERRYMDRALADAGVAEYLNELKRFENEQPIVQQAKVEAHSQQIFDRLINLADPEMGFVAFLNQALKRDVRDVNEAYEKVKNTAAAQVFHKIIMWYRTQGDYKKAAKWTNAFQVSGSSLGTFISAMQEASTPEAIANKMMDEVRQRVDTQMDSKNANGRTGNEIADALLDAAKTTTEEAERVVDTGRNTSSARKQATRKKRVGKKLIVIKPPKDAPKKVKEAQERLTKNRANIKGAIDDLEALLQAKKASGGALEVIRTAISDILDMGATSREQALATFVAEMQEAGVGEARATSAFNKAWKADEVNFNEVVKDNLANAVADRVAKMAERQMTPTKRPTDPVELLARSLFASVADIVPAKEGAQRGKAWNDLAELIRNKEIANKAWEQSLRLVNTAVKGNPDLSKAKKAEIIAQAEDLASEFLTAPLPKSKVRKAIKDGMKDLDLSLKEVMQKSMTEQNETGQTLAEIIVEQTGLEAESAELLEEAIRRDWNAMLADAKEEAVEEALRKEGIDTESKKHKAQKEARAAEQEKEAKSPLERAREEMNDAEDKLAYTELELQDVENKLLDAEIALEDAKASGDKDAINTARRAFADLQLEQVRLQKQQRNDLANAERKEAIFRERQATVDKREEERIEREIKAEQKALEKAQAKLEKEEEAARKKMERELKLKEDRANAKQEQEYLKTLDPYDRLVYRRNKAQGQLERLGQETDPAVEALREANDALLEAMKGNDAKALKKAENEVKRVRKQLDALGKKKQSINERIEKLEQLIVERQQMEEAKLARMVTKQPRKQTNNSKRSKIFKILDAVNAGVLSRDDLLENFADYFGITPLTQEDVSTITFLASRIMATPGLEMRQRRLQEFTDFMKTFERNKLVKLFELAEDLLYAKALSGLTTIAFNIPVGTASSFYSNLGLGIAVNRQAVKAFRESYKILDASGRFGLGMGWRSFKDTLRTGFSMLDNIVALYEHDRAPKASQLSYIHNNSKALLDQARNPAERIALGVLISQAQFQYATNYTKAIDNLFNHKYGEMQQWIDMVRQVHSEGIKDYAEVLEETRKRLKMDDASVELAKQETARAMAAEELMGEPIPIGLEERELKWQIYKRREQEVVQKALETVRGAQLMGTPTGRIGQSLEFIRKLAKYDTDRTDITGSIDNVLRFLARSTILLFARIATKLFNQALLYTPVLGLFTGTFYEKKPVVVDGKREWKWMFNDRNIIMQRLAVQGMMSALTGFLFNHLFIKSGDDPDDQEWILNPDRQIDITLSKGAITGEYYAVEEGYQNLSVRFKKPNGEWGAWYTVKYVPMLISVAAVLGGMRDRSYYLKHDGSLRQKPSDSGAAGRAFMDVARGLSEHGFQQNLRIVNHFAEGFSGSEYHQRRLASEITRPLKTLAPLGSNFERDVAAILLNRISSIEGVEGIPRKKGTGAEEFFFGGHLFFDFIAENEFTDRWGYSMPRTDFLEAVAHRATFGIYPDQKFAKLRDKPPYKMINDFPDMYVPKTFRARSSGFKTLAAYRTKYGFEKEQEMMLELEVAKLSGKYLEQEYKKRKPNNAAEASAMMKQTSERARKELLGVPKVKYPTRKQQTYPAYGLYKRDYELWKKIFPKVKED